MVRQEIDHGFLIPTISMNKFINFVFKHTDELENQCTSLFKNIILLILANFFPGPSHTMDLRPITRLKMAYVSEIIRAV